MKCYSPISDINIYSYAFLPIDSRMYVILCQNVADNAVVIDPCISYEAERLLNEHGFKKITVILTHEHYDHISGVNWLRERFNCKVLCNLACNDAIQKPSKNKSKYFEALFITQAREVQDKVKALHIEPYSCVADVTFEKEYNLNWGAHEFYLTTKEGHSFSSICIFLDDCCLFSGDTLLRTIPITRKPEGDKKIYNEKTKPWLLSLDKEIMVYPGHGDCGRIIEMYLYLEGNTK